MCVLRLLRRLQDAFCVQKGEMYIMSVLLTEKELIELLKVSRTTARRWAAAAGARRMIGNSVRYDAEAIRKAIEKGSEGKSRIGGAR